MSFINGSNDGETMEKKPGKNIIKSRTKKKTPTENSSLKEKNDLVVRVWRWDWSSLEDEIDQALIGKNWQGCWLLFYFHSCKL